MSLQMTKLACNELEDGTAAERKYDESPVGRTKEFLSRNEASQDSLETYFIETESFYHLNSSIIKYFLRNTG
jgi:hypothetical protein